VFDERNAVSIAAAQNAGAGCQVGGGATHGERPDGSHVRRARGVACPTLGISTGP
jgi:hypothetical protein